MTALSTPLAKAEIKAFCAKSRYSYPALLLQFACDWGVDLPDIIARVKVAETGHDIGQLIRGILLAKPGVPDWANKPNVRTEVTALLENTMTMFDVEFKHSPNRTVLTVEFLADGLNRLK